MKKRIFALCLILNLIALNLMFTRQVYAFNGVASFSAPGGTLGQGTEFTAVLSLSSDDGTAFYASGTVTSDPGLQILSVSGDGATVNGTRFIFMNPQAAFSVTVNVRAVGQGTQQLYVSDLKMAPLSDSDEGAQNAPVSTSASVYIITDAEIEAIRQSSIEASRAEEESRSIEESMAASRSAEEASIAQSIAASEAESRSIEESIAASQAAEQSAAQSSIDESRAIEESIAASIAAIEDERRRSEAAEEESRNQSVQASIEAEEQSRRESENYEASVAASLEESRSIEEASRNGSSEEDETSTEANGFTTSSLEQDDSSSESTEEASSEEVHHGTLYKDIYAVRLLGRRKTFEFAVKDTSVKVPEGFTEADLEIKDEPVLAYRCEGMAEDTYLVYGYLGDAEKADFYYYDSTSDEWIAYDKIGSRTVFKESDAKKNDVKESSKETKAPASSSAADTVSDREVITKAAEAGVLSFILGVGITGIISMISMSRKEKQKEDEDTDLL